MILRQVGRVSPSCLSLTAASPRLRALLVSRAVPRRPISTSPRPARRAQSPQAAFALQPDEPSTSYIPPIPPAHATSHPLNLSEEADFRAYFDRYDAGHTELSDPFAERQGLFLFPPLQRPTDLRRLTTRTLIHGQAIVDRICAAPSAPGGETELRKVVKNLDRLSDLICGVVDMCELVRNVHTDQFWIRECDMAYERLCSFMNELNTDQGLYKALLVTLKHPFTQPLSEAETQVALTFMRDFEKSGIHLPTAQRQRFVELSDSIISLGRTFLSNVSAGPRPYPPIEIPDAERLLSGMGSQFIDSLPRGGIGKRNTRYVAPGSWHAQWILRCAREGEARRLVYTGGLRKDEERVEVLERMLRERAELAGVLGKDNWSEVTLVDKMAKTPTNVMGFLNSLADHHRPFAAQDVAALQRVKAHSITGNAYSEADGTGHLPPLYAWDREFCAERYTTTLSNGASLPPIEPYFSTGSVMLGLSKLFTRLYGISFRPCAIAPGEVWHDSVRKLEVVDENGIIGVIYCDLFSREGKPPSAAHYTVRCSRRVDDDDLAGDGLPEGWDAEYGPGLEVAGDRIAGRDGRYQLPVCVLTCDFGTVKENSPAQLHWAEVETLFHEMGHAIHSMIGRTEYHNVSGTRCATDFVELPSILMEHFVSSPDVLSLFANHYSTGEPLPMPLLQQHLAIQKSQAALETHGQIGMAILDQVYHSLSPSSGNLASFDSTKMHYELQQRIGVIPPVEGTAWQTQFGHLFGYGATYYSYLFDRAIAGKVFRTLFSKDARGGGEGGPLSREGGEVLKERILKWGGGKDPWSMVGDVVGGREGEVLSKGDEESMKVVGGWEIR